MRLWPVLARAALASAVFVLATSLAADLERSQERAQDLVLTGSTSGTFRVKGQVSGLYPGRVTTLPLTVVNPNRFAIKVTSLAAKPGNASTRCTYMNLTVSRFSGALRVRANSSRRLELTIAMRRAAPNACRGGNFPLTYHGTAVKA
jgi:hypothetical protein